MNEELTRRMALVWGKLRERHPDVRVEASMLPSQQAIRFQCGNHWRLITVTQLLLIHDPLWWVETFPR